MKIVKTIRNNQRQYVSLIAVSRKITALVFNKRFIVKPAMILLLASHRAGKTNKLIPRVKSRSIILVISLILIVFQGISFAQMKEGKIRRVVLDAGHGGKDPGALGQASREKDIVLAIALKTGKYITESFPDVEVIYTRKSDEFVELDRRAKIANEAHADLFISIHCNSSKSKTPYGTETFVMGIHKSAANLEVAKLENSAILLEDNYNSRYEGYDPRSPESHIIFSLFQDRYREYSLQLATSIQEQFRVRTARFDRGVKEAGFWVLYRTAMPSVLIEAGFISNPAEERYLRTPAGQIEIAATIFRAFKDYKETVEKEGKPADKPEPARQPTTKPEVQTVREEQEPANTDTAANTDPNANHVSKTVAGNTHEETKPSAWLVDDLAFRVQILASPVKVSFTDQRLKDLPDVYEYEHGGMFKYTTGKFDTQEKAEAYRKKIRSNGITDAFVVALYQDRRISNEQARVLTEAAIKAGGGSSKTP